MIEIIKEFKDKELAYGKYDCNLLVLAMNEQEMYKTLLGRYTTVIGGVRVANKEFGYSSIKDWFKDNYETIEKNYEQQFDIMCSNSSHEVVVFMSSYVFGIKEDKFTIIFLNEIDLSDFTTYRKVN